MEIHTGYRGMISQVAIFSVHLGFGVQAYLIALKCKGVMSMKTKYKITIALALGLVVVSLAAGMVYAVSPEQQARAFANEQFNYGGRDCVPRSGTPSALTRRKKLRTPPSANPSRYLN